MQGQGCIRIDLSCVLCSTQIWIQIFLLLSEYDQAIFFHMFFLNILHEKQIPRGLQLVSCMQGHKRNIFEGWQSHVSQYFSQPRMSFPGAVKVLILIDLKQMLVFQMWKWGKSALLKMSLQFKFSPSHLQFFLHNPFPPSFLSRSAKMSH